MYEVFKVYNPSRFQSRCISQWNCCVDWDSIWRQNAAYISHKQARRFPFKN